MFQSKEQVDLQPNLIPTVITLC